MNLNFFRKEREREREAKAVVRIKRPKINWYKCYVLGKNQKKGMISML